MSNTLDRLRKEFPVGAPSLAEVRKRYFSHIASDRYLLRKISAGRIALKVTRHGGAKGHVSVYLHDLAAYLDTQAEQAGA